ncbi:putative rRNA-processing UTP23-like protein [Toxoplasma gondii RUB]|uniref:Putative rRNA-processing UTP23-like protein n=2 Tax=Toxoplasma gondii TaxID=5811 RepID=A0A086M200_TOXGO|nr:putative rRNA-processing UTP23-like protein [Toxoplasma gondii FOU]KFG62918.1 putative rRNA-processing UTP23-like protein [Toxoplasma gondii RUB]
MRISRRKQFKRVMRFYSVGFGIKEPFKVLVDGTFLTAALKHRLSLADQLPLLLGGQCSIRETNASKPRDPYARGSTEQLAAYSSTFVEKETTRITQKTTDSGGGSELRTQAVNENQLRDADKCRDTDMQIRRVVDLDRERSKQSDVKRRT